MDDLLHRKKPGPKPEAPIQPRLDDREHQAFSALIRLHRPALVHALAAYLRPATAAEVAAGIASESISGDVRTWVKNRLRTDAEHSTMRFADAAKFYLAGIRAETRGEMPEWRGQVFEQVPNVVRYHFGQRDVRPGQRPRFNATSGDGTPPPIVAAASIAPLAERIADAVATRSDKRARAREAAEDLLRREALPASDALEVKGNTWASYAVREIARRHLHIALRLGQLSGPARGLPAALNAIADRIEESIDRLLADEEPDALERILAEPDPRPVTLDEIEERIGQGVERILAAGPRGPAAGQRGRN